MGCGSSKDAPARTVQAVESDAQGRQASERERLMEEGTAKEASTVKASQPLIAKSGNKDTQKIIDKIQNGEDFEANKWRCLHSPDFAYYSLSPFAQLEVEIVEARKLIPSVTSGFESYVGDEPDGFVKVFVDDTFKYSTRCINNDRNPKWQDRRRVVDIVADRSIIRLHVYDSDSSDNSTLIDPIGFVEFCIGDIPFDHDIDGWLELRFPGNLQGYNTDRYAEHMAMREEERGTHMPTTRLGKEKGKEEDKNDKSKKNSKKDDLPEAVEPADLYKVEAQVIRESVANRMFKRLRRAGTRANPNADAPPNTQFNAGEIHVKLKLVRCVSENTALFAKALVPSCTSFASFIQEEFLPKLDVQELLDDTLDLKIEIVDEMLFAVYAFACYVLAWRSIIVSGLLFIAVACGVKSSMLVYAFGHLWMAMILVLLKFDNWRLPMTTNGQNAPLNEEGFRFVARCRDVYGMHAYLLRMIASRSGSINSMQELLHFSGTIVQGDGELTVTFDELLKALRELWFLEFPKGITHLEVNSLVRVHDRRRGTVTKIETNSKVATSNPHRQQIHVLFDEEGSTPMDSALDGVYDAWDVSVRPSVPAIPRFLVPQTILSLVATLQLEVDTYKKTILPVADSIREFFRWRKPKWMALVLSLLLFRSYVSFEGFLDENSWCHFALKVMSVIRNVVLGVLIIVVLFGQARIWKVGRGLVMLAVNKISENRKAPTCWAFYKDHSEAYFAKKKKAE